MIWEKKDGQWQQQGCNMIKSILEAEDIAWTAYLSINLSLVAHPALTPPITHCM